MYSEKRRYNTCNVIEEGSFVVKRRSICKRGLIQYDTPNYSLESEDETENKIRSTSNNELESEDKVGNTEETENVLVMKSENETEN